tara:strand:+ start:23465 stop:24130 length:666 start_codon:yes stop_codon:yes gene_type:complete
MDRKIKILKGRAKSFDIFIQDEKGNPKDITGYSIVRINILHSKGCLTKYAPIENGVNEQQVLDLNGPDAGAFKLKFKNETTASMAFNVAAGTMATELNALKELSGITVIDNGGGEYEITFAGNDGSRSQDLISVVESTLTLIGSAVVTTVIETQEGSPENGISVVEVKCGQIKIKLSQEDVDLLDVRNDQDIDLYVRIGTEDLDLDPILFKGVLDVTNSGC